MCTLKPLCLDFNPVPLRNHVLRGTGLFTDFGGKVIIDFGRVLCCNLSKFGKVLGKVIAINFGKVIFINFDKVLC